jgi:hypothetical protein
MQTPKRRNGDHRGYTAGEAFPRPFNPLVISSPNRTNRDNQNTWVTRIEHHTLVITLTRIGSRLPYPSKDDGGHDTIRVHVHSVRPGSPGGVTVGGADPVHPSSSRARSRRE